MLSVASSSCAAPRAAARRTFCASSCALVRDPIVANTASSTVDAHGNDKSTIDVYSERLVRKTNSELRKEWVAHKERLFKRLNPNNVNIDELAEQQRENHREGLRSRNREKVARSNSKNCHNMEKYGLSLEKMLAKLKLKCWRCWRISSFDSNWTNTFLRFSNHKP